MADTGRVLDKINAARVAAGFGPVNQIAKGVRSDAGSCPIANSLKDAFPGIKVNGGSISGFPTHRAWAIAQAFGGKVITHNGTAAVDTPPLLATFIKEFDAGYLRAYNQYA